MTATTGTVGRSTTVHSVKIINGAYLTKCGAENKFRVGAVRPNHPTRMRPITCKKCSEV